MNAGRQDRSSESPRWDPAQYAQFRRERARPFHDLLARVPNRDIRAVADLGCGSGELTRELQERWPQAEVWGVDQSAEMLASATALPGPGHLSFVRSDLREWRPGRPLDLIVSNAALHWVPDHAPLLEHLAGLLAPGGVLAVQIPNNWEEASHRILAELSAEEPWASRLGSVHGPQPIASAAWYLEQLVRLGLEAEAWETTYYHPLPAASAIVDWMKGTALRPVLAALSQADAREFEAALEGRIAQAYAPGPHGVIFPFRRLFFVARAPFGA
ncbi:MAG TPA: methyltransferase domain-containing protein [Myxococcota bacterium]|nr:methyltransferase domain-containing protein [Myxococcota bacterium]